MEEAKKQKDMTEKERREREKNLLKRRNHLQRLKRI